MTRLVMAMIVMLGAVLTACGDDGDGDDRAQSVPVATVAIGGSAATSQGSATAHKDAPDLARALLNLEDFPAGWTTRPVASSSAPAMICGKPAFPIASQHNATAEFERDSFRQVTHKVAAYQDGEGATVMDGAVAVFGSCTEWSDTGSDGTRRAYRLSSLSFPKLGDQTLAFRLEVTAGAAVAQADAVYIRRGDTIAALTVLASGIGTAAVDSTLTEQLARKADERLRTVN